MVQLNGCALKFASADCKADKEIALAAVESRPDALEFVDKAADMWHDKRFVLEMVKANCSALVFATNALKTDGEIVSAVAMTAREAFLAEVSEAHWSDVPGLLQDAPHVVK